MVSLSSPVSLSQNPPSLPFLPFLHRISSLRRRHRPAKPPPRSTDLGLLTSGLERRRTRLEAFELAAEPHAPPAFSPPFWPRHRSGDLPPARVPGAASVVVGARGSSGELVAAGVGRTELERHQEEKRKQESWGGRERKRRKLSGRKKKKKEKKERKK